MCSETDWDDFKLLVSRVPPPMLDRFWEEASEFIESAFREDGCEELSSIRKKILQGHYQLWVVLQGKEMIYAAVTMLIDRGHEVVLHVEYGGAVKNTIQLWKDPVVEAMAAFARAHDGVAIECAGRKGWQAVFPDSRVISVKIRKEL